MYHGEVISLYKLFSSARSLQD